MKLLELTLPAAAENVALDEALLNQAENGELPQGVLRIWESPQYAVILGRASKIEEEANLEFCRAERIPIIRRTSGGASILAGPGCLMYAVVLPISAFPQAETISAAHQLVLGRISESLQKLESSVDVAGTSDLVMGDPAGTAPLLKFSGNSMRKSRSAVLYHGTLLYCFDIDLIELALRTPPRMPDYRDSRRHREFVGNVSIRRDALILAIKSAWSTDGLSVDWPRAATEELVRTKYATDEWNHRR